VAIYSGKNYANEFEHTMQGRRGVVDDEVPLICFYVVEYHLPHHVTRQFDRLQPCLPEDFSTN
jgi:hypothetical protein